MRRSCRPSTSNYWVDGSGLLSVRGHVSSDVAGLRKKYDRTSPELFVGEWAAYETSFPPWDKRSQKEPPTPNLKAAIGNAVFMAAMERNSDLIKMQCCAPLLVNVNPGGRQWRPKAYQPVPGEPLLDLGHCVLRLDAAA